MKIIKPTIDDVIEFENQQSPEDVGIYGPDGRIFRDNIGFFNLRFTRNPISIGMERDYIALNPDDVQEGNTQCGRIIPFLRTTGKVAAGIAVASGIVLVASGVANADYNLHFQHSIDPNDAGYVASDTFNAVGSNNPGVLVSYDINDVLQPPAPPSGDYVQAYTTVQATVSTKNLTKDGQPFDSNLPDNTWLVKLNAYDDIFEGLTGTSHFNLTDPNALNDLPPYALAIAQRQTSTGTPLQNYNLDETPNISWPVNAVQGPHAKMELKIIDEYLRIRALFPTEPVINFKHFAEFANYWKQQGPLPGDINGDNITDIKDLEIFARNWLYDGN